MKNVTIEKLTREAFAPFGDVIEIGADSKSFPINAGTTQRFHELATADVTGENPRVVISMARAKPFELPINLDLLERHPLGSQAFIPVSPVRFLVTVAPDENGRPGRPRAFMARPGQGINYYRGTWHSVLTALDQPTDFIIVDREGDGDNTEVVRLSDPWIIAT